MPYAKLTGLVSKSNIIAQIQLFYHGDFDVCGGVCSVDPRCTHVTYGGSSRACLLRSDDIKVAKKINSNARVLKKLNTSSPKGVV